MPRIPLTIDEASRDARWLDDPVWPTQLDEVRQQAEWLTSVLFEYPRKYPNPMRDLVILAAPRIFAAASVFFEVAFCCQRMGERAWTPVGSRKEFTWFLDPRCTELPWQEPLRPPSLVDKSSRLRRLARTITLNVPSNFVNAMRAPSALAVSHNKLLRNAVHRTRMSTAFTNAFVVLSRFQAQTPISFDSDLVIELQRLMLGMPGLSEYSISRLKPILDHIVHYCIDSAAVDLGSAQAAVGSLPQTLFSGTGGYNPVRALTLAAVRSGRNVVGFDHGGLYGEREVLRITEFQSATHFVTPTAETAAQIRRSRSYASLDQSDRIRVMGHDGDPVFKSMLSLPRVQIRAKPRVLYVLGLFGDLRQFYPPIYQDPVYLSVVLQVIRHLKGMPIDLVCRPRPKSPSAALIQRYADCDFRSYRQALADANILVFDDGRSTAFTEALCSDRPIVMIDLGYNTYDQSVLTKLAKRVTTVSARGGEGGVPTVSLAALSSAVLSSPPRADGSEFAEMFAASKQPSEAVEYLSKLAC